MHQQSGEVDKERLGKDGLVRLADEEVRSKGTLLKEESPVRLEGVVALIARGDVHVDGRRLEVVQRRGWGGWTG